MRGYLVPLLLAACLVSAAAQTPRCVQALKTACLAVSAWPRAAVQQQAPAARAQARVYLQSPQCMRCCVSWQRTPRGLALGRSASTCTRFPNDIAPPPPPPPWHSNPGPISTGQSTYR